MENGEIAKSDKTENFEMLFEFMHLEKEEWFVCVKLKAIKNSSLICTWKQNLTGIYTCKVVKILLIPKIIRLYELILL